MFTQRKTKPEAGNKHFIREESGGWNSCIKGNPTDKNCDVLANCVGYANGRFNEIYSEVTGYKGNKYNTLNCNAENFIERAKSAGLEIVDYPTLGGIMVMQKGDTLSGSDGAGHVFIPEALLEFGDDGYANKIYTSESAYLGSSFFNVTRSNSNGRWGHASGYKFRGCIVNPAIGKEGSYNKPIPKPSTLKFKEGDKVIINGSLYVSANAEKPAGTVSNKVTYITRREEDAKHPYNTTGDLGWMDESSIQKYTEPKPTEIKEGDIVTVTGSGNGSSSGTSRSWTRKYSNQKMKVIIINKGTPYPYACNQYGEGTVGRASDVTGWFAAKDITK